MNGLIRQLERLGSPRILVLGDLMLDRYVWGDVSRISPEAPIPVLSAEQHEARQGGAASVAGLLRGLGAGAAVAGITGSDTAAAVLRQLLDEHGIDYSYVISNWERPTTVKERFIGRAAGRHSHQMLRVDQESRAPLERSEEKRLANGLAARIGEFDVLLVSDYAKGVCTPRLLERVIAAANRSDVPVIVDPARIDDYGRYQGANLITPNRVEAELAAGQQINSPEDAITAGQKLCEQHGFPAVLVTLDSEGAALVQAGGVGRVFPTRQRAVYDVTGAGDTVLAMVGLCFAADLSMDQTVELTNEAAGLQVERHGVCTVTRDEIAAELLRHQDGSSGKAVEADELAALVAAHRRQGHKIVFTNGCFDLLHVGHVSYLQEAAALGDVLIVAINSDTGVQRLKGSDRPVIPQADRTALLAALECVDYVVVFDEDTPHNLLRRLRPDVLVKGGTYSEHEVVGREVVARYGGAVHVTRPFEGVSTTGIIELVRNGRATCPM